MRLSDGKVQILVEIDRYKMRTEDGGTVVVIADEDLIADSLVPVGDRKLQPRVECKVYTKLPPREVTAMRRRMKVRKNSPVLFTSL